MTNPLQKLKDGARKLLVRSQSYTGTDNIYVAKSGFWAMFPYVFGTLLSAAQVLAFANFLPKETYGTYKYILSATSIFGFLTFTGMNAAVTQMTASGIEGALSWSVRLQLRFNSLYAIAAAIAGVYYALHGNTTIAYGILLIGVAFPVSTALNTYGAYLSGKKEFQRGALYGASSNIFSSVLLLSAIILSGNIIVIIVAYALGSVLPGAFFYIYTVRTARAAKLLPEQKRELAMYGGHLSFINILSTIGQYVDKIILFHATGAVQLAVYSLAQAMPNRVEGLLKSWSSILLPKLTGRSIPEIHAVFYRRVLQGLMIGVVAASTYWVCAPLLFRFLLPRYLDGLLYSQVMMLSVIFTLPGAYAASIFRSQRIIPAIYASSTFANVTLISLFAVFGTIWGTWGLILGQITAQMLGVVFNCFLWERIASKAARNVTG